VAFTKTYIKVDEYKVVNEGRRWDMDVDMCNNRWGVKALKTSRSVFRMDSGISDVPLSLVESETPSNAWTNDGSEELDSSPLRNRGRVSLVWMNSLRKFCATVSLALSGS
jgi:hypothetical protein